MTEAGAYYNEHDAYASRWIAKLVERDLVAPGHVDARSVADVTPEDLRHVVQAHFFAGIGVWSAAARLAGWPNDVPLWSGSCPCQPFSDAGARGGLADERHLWPVWFELIRACRPGVVVGEQVASPAGLGWLDVVFADLEGAGYACRAIDFSAASVGAPHRRQRTYFVAFDIATGGGRRIADALAHHHRREGVRLGGLPDDGIPSPRRDADGRSEARGGSRSMADDARDGSGARHSLGGRSSAGVLARDQGDGLGSSDDGSARSSMGNTSLDGDRQYARELRRNEGEHDVRSADGDHAPLEASGDDGGRDRAVALTDEPHPVHGRTPRSWRVVRVAAHATASGSGHLTDGYWRDADWIPCSDGRARPVRPGTFPLAYGATARVGRLRAYGNAIVRTQAATFLTVVRDTLIERLYEEGV